MNFPLKGSLRSEGWDLMEITHLERCVSRFLSLHDVWLWVLLWWKWKFGRKGFNWLTLYHFCSPLKEIRTTTYRIQREQDPRGSSWWRGHGDVLITDLLSLSCSAHLLIETRISNPGCHQPTLLNVLHLDLKESFQVWLRPLMTLACVKLTHKAMKYSLNQINYCSVNPADFVPWLN